MPETIGYPVKGLTSENAEAITLAARENLLWGRKFREQKREDSWRQSEQQYQGNHWAHSGGSQDPTADLVVVNISFSTVNTLVPYVTGSDPRFLVEPYSGDATVLNARQQAAWINRFWRTGRSGARRAVRTSAVDSLIYGDGYGKVTFELRGGEDEPTTADLYVDRVDPWNLWIDPMSDGLHNARWVVERVYTTLSELEATGNYTNLDQLSVGIPDLTEAGSDRQLRNPEGGDDNAEWVTIYEYWDLLERRLVVIGDDTRFPLRISEEITCPIVPLENHWLPAQPYHMGDLEQIWPLQMELNKSRSQMLTHRRRNIPKFLAKADVLDGEAEQALLSEVVGQVVKVTGDRSLQDVIQPVALSPLSADAYNVSDLIMRDVLEVTGVNEYLRGATPAIRRTATEASIIEGASNVKSAHKLAKIEEFVRDLGTLVLDIAADVFPQTDADEMQMYIGGRDAEGLNKAVFGEHLLDLEARGADPEILQMESAGFDQYGEANLTMTPDVFEGVYQVEVVQNSTELRNPVFKSQKYRELARQMTEAAPLLQQFGVSLNLRKIYELWLEAEGIQDIDSMFEAATPQAAPPQALPQQPKQAGGMGGLVPPGMPNPFAEGAPLDGLTAENTGALPPEA